MQHAAKLNLENLDVGASLVISGSRLQTGDTVRIDLSDKTSVTAEITAFGLGRLVMTAAGKMVECRPWNSADDTVPKIDGPTSIWTIRSIA